MEIFILITLGIALVASGFWAGALFFWHVPAGKLFTRKTVTLPCPACRDDDDKPTGIITPTNDVLLAEARRVTKDGEPPSFTCATCDGTKKVTYEFQRGERVRINDRQMVEGGGRQIERRRFFGRKRR